MTGRNLLIVDDKADNLRLLAAIFAEKGYKVRKALNGKTAIDTIRTVPPDLILLDINMPDLDGYEVCQILKADLTTKDIPIIFISALGDVLDKVKAFQVGGLDYITKPFQEEEVIARVENQLTIRRQQEQLEQEIQKRQKTEERLRIYLHAVSHDLRNPTIGLSMVLKNLLNQPEILESPATIPVLRSTLERMANSCDRQLQLINSLVEIQQQDIWGISLRCEPLNLHSLTQEVLIEWTPLLEEHQATSINQVTPELPFIYADPYQLWRVYENLLANALKYNPPGLEIKFDAQILQGQVANSPLMVRCWVTDNGLGMSSEQADALFIPYYRGQGVQRNIGSGLGLYLCRQIVQAHGGTIGVIAQPQNGSQFWFTLPLYQ